MSQNITGSSVELYHEIETLYLKEHFHSILKFEPVFTEIELYGFDSEKTKCLYEIFARTYLEFDKLIKAKNVIDQRLHLLSDKDIGDADHAEDLFIFTLLKMELLQKQELLKEEYKTTLAYEKQGGNDNKILNRKHEIEERLYMGYVKVNKYILYMILLSVLLVNLDFIPSNPSYVPILTTIAVVWYFLNYVMNCRVKQFYLKVIRFIYS